MKGLALIVDAGTPDLTALAVRSVEKFAPGLAPRILPSIGTHADTLEQFRSSWSWWAKYDVIVLLDSDAAILSPAWWVLVDAAFDGGDEAVGGHRSRGDASQMFIDGRPILHASCLAMTTGLWARTPSFKSEWDETTQFHQIDTAGQVSLEAESLYVCPFRRVGHGALYPGLQVGEYFSPLSGETLWVHAWRGTSSRTPRWRHQLRRVKAALGSPHAVSMLRHEARVAAYIARTRELLA